MTRKEKQYTFSVIHHGGSGGWEEVARADAQTYAATYRRVMYDPQYKGLGIAVRDNETHTCRVLRKRRCDACDAD